MARQMPPDERKRNADYVIENNKDIGSLETETMWVYEKLRRDLDQPAISQRARLSKANSVAVAPLQ